MKRFIIAHETAAAVFSVLYVVGGMAFSLWLGSGFVVTLFAISAIGLIMLIESCFPHYSQLDLVIQEMAIDSAAYNAVRKECGTCRMFQCGRCHRIAPFVDVTEFDWCQQHRMNFKSPEYLAARKVAEEGSKK